jgi:hypothetical protein
MIQEFSDSNGPQQKPVRLKKIAGQPVKRKNAPDKDLFYRLFRSAKAKANFLNNSGQSEDGNKIYINYSI